MIAHSGLATPDNSGFCDHTGLSVSESFLHLLLVVVNLQGLNFFKQCNVNRACK